MLEGFKAITDIDTLLVIKSRLSIFHKKLLDKKSLSYEEDRNLKLYLFADIGPGRTFQDDTHRIQLIDQWLKEAPLHEKSLKDQQEKI